MAIPALFFREGLIAVERKERKLRHAVLAFFMLFGAWVLAAVYMVVLYTILGLSQPPL